MVEARYIVGYVVKPRCVVEAGYVDEAVCVIESHCLFTAQNTQHTKIFLVIIFGVNDYISNQKIGLARIYDIHNEAHFSKE